ncbi:MAG: hypothetical protein ACRDGB_03060 [Candidatus Limnocylindria bacterium]
MPAGSHIESASAFVAGALTDHHALDVHEAELLGFPPHTVMVSVALRWAGGSDALYSWAVEDAPAAP